MGTRTVNIREAQTNLRKLLSQALEGNEVIITEDNKPLVKLVSLSQPPKKRVAGLNRGKIWVGKDFDKPLSDKFWIGAT